VNLTGAFQTVQIAAERMKSARKGSIVLTASTNSFDGEADLVAYNASKAGLLGILHTAANELGPYGIRINAVCPGLIRTRLTASSFSNPRVLSDYFKHIALGRGGEPEEVAQAVMFLASDLASYITGTTLVVDGGQMASKFGTWGNETDRFDGHRWTRGS
jgi:NAD(P)-dependent dehydrogenase (short-subunit alcohol dehydrogenase family)